MRRIPRRVSREDVFKLRKLAEEKWPFARGLIGSNAGDEDWINKGLLAPTGRFMESFKRCPPIVCLTARAARFAGIGKAELNRIREKYAAVKGPTENWEAIDRRHEEAKGLWKPDI